MLMKFYSLSVDIQIWNINIFLRNDGKLLIYDYSYIVTLAE